MSFIPIPNAEEGWIRAIYNMFSSQYAEAQTTTPPETPGPTGRTPSQCGTCRDCLVQSLQDHCWVCGKEYSPPFSYPWQNTKGPDYSVPDPFFPDCCRSG